MSERVLNNQCSQSEAQAPSCQVQHLSALTSPSMQPSSTVNMGGGSTSSNTGRKLQRTYAMLGKPIVLAQPSCISDCKIKTSMQMRSCLLYWHHSTPMPGLCKRLVEGVNFHPIRIQQRADKPSKCTDKGIWDLSVWLPVEAISNYHNLALNLWSDATQLTGFTTTRPLCMYIANETNVTIQVMSQLCHVSCY